MVSEPEAETEMSSGYIISFNMYSLLQQKYLIYNLLDKEIRSLSYI